MSSSFPNIEEFITIACTSNPEGKVGVRAEVVTSMPEEVERASLSLPLTQEVLLRVARCLEELKPSPFSVYIFTGILMPLLRHGLPNLVVDENLLMGMTRFLVRFRKATKDNKFNERQTNDLEEGVTYTVITAWCRAEAAVRRPAADYLREHGLNSSFAHLNKSRFVAILLELLEDEALLVIDTVTQRAMQVRISNISFNMQLSILIQHALRLQYEEDTAALEGVPEEWCPAVRKKVIQQADGTAPQAAVSHREIPWDLLDHTAVVKSSTKGSTPGHQQKIRFNRDSEHWIWNEGMPADIAPCTALGGMRVVLLAPPSYSRCFNFTREFEKLVPKFNVVKYFGAEETADFLRKIAADSSTVKASAGLSARSGASVPSEKKKISKAARASGSADTDSAKKKLKISPKKRWKLGKGKSLGSPRRRNVQETAAAVDKRMKRSTASPKAESSEPRDAKKTKRLSFKVKPGK
jgi:hypothetical protein